MIKYLLPFTALALAGCNVEVKEGSDDSQPRATAPVGALKVGDVSLPCMDKSDIAIHTSRNELTGVNRAKFLTDEAQAAGVRVWVSSSDVTNYGNAVIKYSDPEDNCILWAESLSLQEYSAKLGMSPLRITTGYEPTKPEGN